MLAADVLNISIPDESIQNARTRFLPSNVVHFENNLLLIYSLNGESRSDKRIKLIEAFNILNTTDENEIQVMDDTSVSFLYFFDADDKGTAQRRTEVNDELSRVFKDKFSPIDTISEIKLIDNISFGLYVFTEHGQDIGKLEDVLLPMMEEGNEDIFIEARQFSSIHEGTKLYQGQVEYQNDTNIIKKVFNEKYHPKKSLIGTIGQLEKSGKSNTVCISDSKYLNEDKLTTNNACNQIISFIKKALK